MQLSCYHFPYEQDVIFGSLGLAFSTQWKGCTYAHITTLGLLPKIIKWARLATHTNHISTTIITITHNDSTNNPTNPLQRPHVTPILTIPTLILQYTKTLPFPTYYYNKEPLLTSILILSHTHTTPQIPTFLQQLPTTLLPTCTTYPTYPTHPPTITLISPLCFPPT